MSLPAEPAAPWILTASGRVISLRDPHPSDVEIKDLAHALSRLCRFGGHAREHYSVAQHCLIVSLLAPPEFELAALLHDAPEAYLGDVVSPLKSELYRYRLLEARFCSVIEERFGLDPLSLRAPEVLDADRQALAIERRFFLPDGGPPWPELEGVEVPEVTLVALSPDAARLRYETLLRQLLGARRSSGIRA
jgi:hypothetical protein